MPSNINALPRRERDIAFGRASGIPECCIAWWIDHNFCDFSHEQQVAPCDYVPCPDCTAANRFVEIHRCDQEALYRGDPCPGCGVQLGPRVIAVFP